MAAVNSNMFEINVRPDSQNGTGGGTQFITLPLNLVALIVTLIDDPGDLARMCRTCRLLHYMAIPHLYRDIVLTSYDRIRYRGEQPEGWGNASPFSMALNTLVTRTHASLVHSMTLRGDWNEPELEEHSRVGRVPDSSMMLNITVRAALDRTRNIESFSWELNTKLMETVYLGLLRLPKLKSLSLRFPSSRHPRPIYVIPAMPHLRSLKITDIDPLCYPDDVSTLLAKSPHLEDLKMHWSPRMRETQEPSVAFHEYFRHCIMNKSPLKLKKIAFQNLFSRLTDEFEAAVDINTLEEMTFLSNSGNDDALSNLTFVDKTWSIVRPPVADSPKLKMMRQDMVSKEVGELISSFKGMEKLYCVNTPRSFASRQISRHTAPRLMNNGTPSHHVNNGLGLNSTMSSVVGNGSITSPSSPRSPASSTNQFLQLRDTYFNAILTNHGATLRHLVLPSRWPLSSTSMARLVHVCPNLEQLAMAPEVSALEAFGLLLPFLRKLEAFRILVPPVDKFTPGHLPTHPNSPMTFSSMYDMFDVDDDTHAEKIGAVTADKNLASRLKMVGIGWKAWELGDFYYVPASSIMQPVSELDSYRPIDNTRPVDSTVLNGHESPIITGPVGEFTGVSPSHRLRSAETPIPSATKMPKSSLGKRVREEAPSSVVSPTNKFSLVVEKDNIYETLPSGEEVIWRRHVRPVTWDVAKRWEIWALDSQDL